MSRFSIVIPTLNPDLELLVETLNSAFRSFGSMSHEIEVLVCDNGSSNPVLESGSLDTFMKNGLICRRFKNNLGFDENLIRAAEAATGDYVLFLGDDDLLSPDSISQTANALAKNSPELAQGEAIFFNTEMQPDLSADGPDWKSGGRWEGAALSTIIFRRLSFISAAKSVSEVAGATSWIHFLSALVLEHKSGLQRQECPSLHVGIRTGRTKNWELHFGSQYLAGIELVVAMGMLTEAGMVSNEVFSAYLKDRLRTNIVDVLTLTSALDDKKMSDAALALMGLEDSLAVVNPKIFVMKLPKRVRLLSSVSFRLLGKAKRCIMKSKST